MNKKQLLQILVVANVLCAFASVGAEAFFGWTLPPVLAQYQLDRFHTMRFGILRLVGMGVCSLLAFTAWIGLARLWRPARSLYLVSWAAWLLFILLTGARVRTSVSSVFSALEALTAGMIFCLVYFTELAREFQAPSVQPRMERETDLNAHAR